MSFSEELKKENKIIWDKILEHPFIYELGSGKLPIDKFLYYITQDYLYLIDFAKCIGLAAVKANDVISMRKWVQRMDDCLRYEAMMIENLFKKTGLTKENIEKTEKSPTCNAYLNHLLKVAYSGTLGENLAALLPCMWTYMDVANTITKIGGYKNHPIYNEWCNAYDASDYKEIVQKYILAVNELAEDSGSFIKKMMKIYFRQSLKYEYMFWEMAYAMEKWPI